MLFMTSVTSAEATVLLLRRRLAAGKELELAGAWCDVTNRASSVPQDAFGVRGALTTR